jgi:acyl-CoA synthetase (AMP-forming)/AMP-acid ligase II
VSLADLLDGDPADVVAYRDDVAATRGEVDAAASALAAHLRDHDLGGRAMGVLLPNEPDAIAAWFGAWRAGAAFVPLNPRVPAAELARMIDVTGVAVVVTHAELADHVDATASTNVGPFVVLGVDNRSPRVVDPGDAIIQFTSGTTGKPKAVVLRHGTVGDLLDNVIGSLRGGGKRSSNDRPPMPNLVPVSLSLWAGIYQVLFAFRLGAPVVLMARFDPLEFARLVARYEIGSSVLPPAAMVMLLQDERVTSLAPLRYVRSVSAPLSPAHARAFHERFAVAILNGYGQTELGGEVVGWTAADWKQFGPAKLGAVGRPHAGIDVRVGPEGELEIHSPAPLPVDDPALAGRVTDDGWLRTGDLGRVDADGFVWVDGRVSAMINRGGLKVFPDEVEEALRAFDGIADVAVAGVPDARLGEVPWAFVVRHAGATVDPDALRAFAHDRMAPYKVPAGVTFVDALPRNEIGKLLRQDLVPLAQADREGSDR